MTESEAARERNNKEEQEASSLTVKAGDVVVAEYDAWIQDTKELFETTSETVAKENNIYDEKVVYGPQPLIVGKARLFPGLDESMLKAEVGKEYEVIIPPEKAAGPRDQKLVELHPVREFIKQEIEPRVGLEVTVKGKPAIITAVTAGRVRVDFNNRLAGRTLRYKYKIVEKPTKPTEIVRHLLKMSYGSDKGFEIEHHEKNFRIKLPDACKYDQKWALVKYRVVTDMRDLLGAETISLIEEYTKPERKEEAKEEEKLVEEKKPEEAPKRESAPEELAEEDRRG